MKDLKKFLRRFNLDETDVKEAIEKHHIHRMSYGGSSWIVHFDRERNEIDVYKLEECCSLELMEKK